MVRWFLRLMGVAVVTVAVLVPVARAGIIPVDPRGTFLLTSGEFLDNSVFAPLIIDLAALGYGAGTPLHLRVVGTHALAPDGPMSADAFNYLGGIFSAGNTLLPANRLDRVTGAIGTALPALVSQPTLFGGGLPTDTPHDFQIFDTLVAVPDGALFLFVAVPDIFYSDNTDPDGNFGVEISIAEPGAAATLAMLAAGLLLRRRHQALRAK